MARTRRQERIEPQLSGSGRGGGDGRLDLRLSDEDRPIPRPRRQRGPGGDGSGSRRKTGKAKGRGRARRKGGAAGILRRVIKVTLVVGLFCVLAVGGVLAYYAAKLPNMTSWAIPDRPPNIQVVALDGSVIANRGDTGGEEVALKDLPPYLPEAVIAIEDRRFYSHFGVDPFGLLRAALSNFHAGGVVQGGSTITQQLAKNLFLSPDRTMERKVQEVILALWLEARYSKEQILEMYLNRVYLGGGAYGVDAAARRYFGKPARQVTLAEAAILAGLLKAPSRYAPSSNMEAARERAAVVLQAMTEAGYITADQAKTAKATDIPPPQRVAGGSGGYVADWVVDQLPDLIGPVKDDIIVETTIDPRLQDAAATAIAQGIDKDGKDFGASQAALVAMAPDGTVRALVGGRDYAKSQFDRAVDAHRQPGSSFKPFVYLTALEWGLTPETVRIDQQVTIHGWTPANYGKTYKGPVTLQTALAQSINTVAAQLANEVGPANVVATAHRLGIGSELQPNPSIALGTSEVTLLELTGAYAPFASGGYGAIPHVVSRIRTEAGKVLYERAGTGAGLVTDPTFVGMMNEMLRDTVLHGTGTKAQVPGWDLAGKTGTSQDYRDAWFIGYSATLVAGVWFGNDDGKPTKRTTGGSLPATTWQRFMVAALDGQTPAPLPGAYQFRDPSNFDPNSMPAQDAAPVATIDERGYEHYQGDRYNGGADYVGPNVALGQPDPDQPAVETFGRALPPAPAGDGPYANGAGPQGYGSGYPDPDRPAMAGDNVIDLTQGEQLPPGSNYRSANSSPQDYPQPPAAIPQQGPVPPADIGAGQYRQPQRGGFLQRLFGG